MVIKFPTRLTTIKNPIIDFYEKCIFQVNETKSINLLNVTAFTVNPQDYKVLEKKLENHIKKLEPRLPLKKLKFEVGMIMLNYGPRVLKTVQKKTVVVDMENLYDEYIKNKK